MDDFEDSKNDHIEPDSAYNLNNIDSQTEDRFGNRSDEAKEVHSRQASEHSALIKTANGSSNKKKATSKVANMPASKLRKQRV
jgi:conjugal transfer/entry exclusion protein